LSNDFESARAALRTSHDTLTNHVRDMSAAQLGERSYASEWSIADVLSHIGSQAEIIGLVVDAGLNGNEAPEQDTFMAIWDVWNAKSPEAQRDDSIAANEKHIAFFESLTPEQIAAFSVPFFGRNYGAADFLKQLRISEHALHAWDIEVAPDASTTLHPATVPHLLDGLASRIGRVGKPGDAIAQIHVETSKPQASYFLSIQPSGVSIEPWDGQDSSAELHMPAEAFIRLTAGRLDAAHTPESVELKADDLGLDQLRTIFPGY
jgi:uncharacterized protein (TIGR03083 family)